MDARKSIIVKEGVLQVLESGFIRSSYQRRYFLLNQSASNSPSLIWKSSHTDENELGSMLLDSNFEISKNEDQCGLVLKSFDTTLTLRAANFEEAVAWTSAISTALFRPTKRFVLSKSGAYLPSEERNFEFGEDFEDAPHPFKFDDLMMSEINLYEDLELESSESVGGVSSPRLPDVSESIHTPSASWDPVALKTSTFRNRIISNCSVYGGELMTPTSTVLKRFSYSSTAVPAVPKTPPPTADTPSFFGGAEMIFSSDRCSPSFKLETIPSGKEKCFSQNTGFHQTITQGESDVVCVE